MIPESVNRATEPNRKTLLQILGGSADGEFDQVASFEKSVTFLGYQANEHTNEIKIIIYLTEASK